MVDYTSGSGTNTLTFNYSVASGHNSPDLYYVSTTSLSLNGGTIKNTDNNDAILTFPAPGTSGSLGANKALIIDATLPNAPTNLIANPISQTQINLSWINNSSNETSFEVEREESSIKTTAAGVISYSDNSGLSCGTTYSYSVKAKNDYGESSATTTNASTLTCPPTTYNL